jgi:glycosyltransferase involved in cell wall biosynthesis
MEGGYPLNIAYFQHPHEFKTNSASFFRGWFPQPKHNLNRIDRNEPVADFDEFDLVICFQADEVAHQLQHLDKPILIVPMLDESLTRNGDYFRGLGNVKFLSFSKNLHNFLLLNGLNSIHFQHWLKPEFQTPTQNSSKRAFFWERTPEHLSINDVINILGADFKIHYRRHLDPHHMSLEVDYAKHPNINQISSNWLSHHEYLELIRRSTVCFSPRKWEGIGVSTLEALSMGIPIIGRDFPTLNEYVINGVNGLFVSKESKIDSNFDFEALTDSTRRYVDDMYHKWKIKLPNVIAEIEDLKSYKCQKKSPLIPSKVTLREYVHFANGT